MSRSVLSKGQRQPIRFLGYGLPRNGDDVESRKILNEGFEFHDEPLRSQVSFLDYDGVVVCGRSFEAVEHHGWQPEVLCTTPADLDRREREFYSLIEQDKPFIFLLSALPTEIGTYSIPSSVDLFRRVAASFGLDWISLDKPTPFLEAEAPEFREYLQKYGSGYCAFGRRGDVKEFAVPLFVGPKSVFGVVYSNKVFVIPCTEPQRHAEVVAAASAAIHATLAYRARMSRALPEWTATFLFGKENDLRGQRSELHGTIAALDHTIEQYADLKGALCLQSNPLVAVVCQIFERFFGIHLIVDDKCIEDATLLNGEGGVAAVFEIKGVKGSFTRGNVNQLDSHRERLNLPPATPGVLIMNTMMSASSLDEKDEAPHPDIIVKAVADHVLLIRTLDLLRYADAVERGVLPSDGLLPMVLGESGWLKVENDTVEIVKE